MKFIISVVLIAILSYALCTFLPWWMIAVSAFVVSVLIKQKPFLSFLSGFVAIFLLWGLLSFFINMANDSILASRVSQLVLKVDSPTLMILLSAFIGGVVAGFASIAGSFARPKAVV